MERFSIRIADVVIGISAEFSETKAFCRDFLTVEAPATEIVLTKQDRERALKTHKETDISEGRSSGIYSERLLEKTALHMRLMEELIHHHAVLFHGCAVAAGGRVYLFCADSGTGKSTHAGLWLKNIPHCHILNGDKPVLTFRNETVCVCGTPWRGKENLGTDEILPLGAICFLGRDTENHIEQISFKAAFNRLLRHSHRPGDTPDLLQYMKLMQKLAAIPIYSMGCNMTDDAAFVAYGAMVKE